MQPTAQAVGQMSKKETNPEGVKEAINADFITLARVVKTQGRQGEVAVEVHSDIPDRFATGLKLHALPRANRKLPADRAGSERVLLEVEDFWPHKSLLVLKFVGVDSISDAEALIGSELQVPRAERAELEEGWTFVSDLVGCSVFDCGKEIGRIEDVQFGAGAAPLLIVVGKSAGGEVTKYDVPFAEMYLERVDAARREVRMTLPEGMLEINAPLTQEEKKQQSGVERARLKPRRTRR
jgi:16S rRNA processing protein RimM